MNQHTHILVTSLYPLTQKLQPVFGHGEVADHFVLKLSGSVCLLTSSSDLDTDALLQFSDAFPVPLHRLVFITFVILVDLQSQRNELKRLFVIVSYQLSGLVASVGAAIFGRHGSSGLSEQAQEKQEQSPEQGQREPGEGSDEGEQPVQ